MTGRWRATHRRSACWHHPPRPTPPTDQQAGGEAACACAAHGGPRLMRGGRGPDAVRRRRVGPVMASAGRASVKPRSSTNPAWPNREPAPRAAQRSRRPLARRSPPGSGGTNMASVTISRPRHRNSTPGDRAIPREFFQKSPNGQALISASQGAGMHRVDIDDAERCLTAVTACPA
jgi:hypothetical protein